MPVSNRRPRTKPSRFDEIFHVGAVSEVGGGIVLLLAVIGGAVGGVFVFASLIDQFSWSLLNPLSILLDGGYTIGWVGLATWMGICAGGAFVLTVAGAIMFGVRFIFVNARRVLKHFFKGEAGSGRDSGG